MAAAGLIDPTKKGNYPVILGDGLMSGSANANEIFTGVRYNHKPTFSSDTASGLIKPSRTSTTPSYDLTVNDHGEEYAFKGTRSEKDHQYVLYFDPDRKAFVLDKVDSTFNMNVTKLPDNSDPDRLRKQFPPIKDAPAPSQDKPTSSGDQDNHSKKEKPAPKPTPKSSATSKAAPKAAPKPRAKESATQKKEVKRKPEKKKAQPSAPLALPQPEPSRPEPKSKPKPKATDEEEEDDDDLDDLLIIEDPAGESASRMKTQKSSFLSQAPFRAQRFDDYMNQLESEGDDADGEEDDAPDYGSKLTSPVNNYTHQQEDPEPMEEDDDEDDEGGGDLEDDLMKEMENAFEELENSQEGGSPDGDESEISEED